MRPKSIAAHDPGEGFHTPSGCVNPALVRAYDLRGEVGTTLTPADARALGRAYADAVAPGSRVAVGQDGRLSSPALAAALVEGLVAGGLSVARIGQGPTGMLYHAVHAHDLAGGIMVTGSHNPPDQNGFKLLVGREPVFGPALAELAVHGERSFERLDPNRDRQRDSA